MGIDLINLNEKQQSQFSLGTIAQDYSFNKNSSINESFLNDCQSELQHEYWPVLLNIFCNGISSKKENFEDVYEIAQVIPVRLVNVAGSQKYVSSIRIKNIKTAEICILEGWGVFAFCNKQGIRKRLFFREGGYKKGI